MLPVERLRSNTSNQPGENVNNNVGRGRLTVPDESTLSRFVAARLDLWISQILLNRNFKLSIIKRCWEDQLRLKRVYDKPDLFLSKDKFDRIISQRMISSMIVIFSSLLLSYKNKSNVSMEKRKILLFLV